MNQPERSARPVVIYGPAGCGKSRNAAALAKRFGCTQIVDDWDGRSRLPAGALALTNQPPRSLSAGRLVEFSAALLA